MANYTDLVFKIEKKYDYNYELITQNAEIDPDIIRFREIISDLNITFEKIVSYIKINNCTVGKCAKHFNTFGNNIANYFKTRNLKVPVVYFWKITNGKRTFYSKNKLFFQKVLHRRKINDGDLVNGWLVSSVRISSLNINNNEQVEAAEKYFKKGGI